MRNLSDSQNKEFDPRVTAQYFKYDYHDRGMLRWNGFYLSDHQSALKARKQTLATTYPPRPQQSLDVIGALLADAYAQGIEVSIQTKECDESGVHFPDNVGHVSGYNSDNIVVNNGTLISIENIQNVQYNNPKAAKWTRL